MGQEELIVNLIANTTTRLGLRIGASLDEREYPTGKRVTDEQMANLNIERDDFRSEWNYKISPRQLTLIGIR